MTGMTQKEVRDASRNSLPVPTPHANMFRNLDIMIDRMKTQQGIFTTNDAHHAAHIMQRQNAVIYRLMSDGVVGIEAENIIIDANDAAESLISQCHLKPLVSHGSISDGVQKALDNG